MPEQEFVQRPADAQILQDKDINYRVMDVQHFGEAMPSYFHKAIGGYHAAKLSRYNDLINNQIAKNNIQVLNMLNTRYVIVWRRPRSSSLTSIPTSSPARPTARRTAS